MPGMKCNNVEKTKFIGVLPRQTIALKRYLDVSCKAQLIVNTVKLNFTDLSHDFIKQTGDGYVRV